MKYIVILDGCNSPSPSPTVRIVCTRKMGTGNRESVMIWEIARYRNLYRDKTTAYITPTATITPIQEIHIKNESMSGARPPTAPNYARMPM